HPLFTTNGEFALVVSQGPNELSIVDPVENAVKARLMVGKMPHWIATTPDNHTAFVTNEESNDISVVDLAAQKIVATVPVGNAPRKIVIQPRAATAGRAEIKTGISGMSFESALSAMPGQPIVWTNNDSISHTITSDDELWDAGKVAPRQSYALVLDKPGTYAYHCSIHPFMQGQVVVQG
ncbi:MAG TPA: cupredoxin domain-containing protein, partial [Anaerolineae bacterium]